MKTTKPRTAFRGLPRSVLLCFHVCTCPSVSGCSDPVPSRPALASQEQSADAGGTSAPWIDLTPDTALDAVARVVRIALRFDAPVAPSRALLFDGALSATQVREVRKGKVSETLAKRIEPMEAWRSEEPSRVVFRPLMTLTPKTVHTLALDSPEFLATFVVAESDAMPILRRVWPPGDASAGAGAFVIYCGTEPLGPIARSEAFEPSGRTGRWIRGVGASFDVPSCLRWTAQRVGDGSKDGPAVSPPLVVLDDGRAVGLEPFVVRSSIRDDVPSPIECASTETAIALGCAEIQDDRILVRSGAVPLLWGFEGHSVIVSSPNERFVVKREPDRGLVRGGTIDSSGNLYEAEIELPTLPAQAHVVINEVYADPIGAEPAQEWVEIFNDGTASTSLLGYELQDSAGSSVLPSVDLGVGQFAVIAGKDFVVDDGMDPPVDPGATVIRIPVLGKNGLSNSGETLLLRNEMGEIVSRFPAMATHPGISNIRDTPGALDDDPTCFVPSPNGNATPGAPNR